MRRYALRDEQWEKNQEGLPDSEGYVGGSAKDNRLFIGAVLSRRCRQLSQMTEAARYIAPKKFREVLS